MWKEDHHFYAAAMHFPFMIEEYGKKEERIEVIFSSVWVFLSPLISLLGSLFTLRGRGNSSFQSFPLTNAKLGLFPIIFVSVLLSFRHLCHRG